MNMWQDKIHTPAYVLDEKALLHNLEILKDVIDTTGAHILLASKAFSTYQVFPLIGEYLDGVTSSGLYEAKLGKEEMKKEVHTFSPAYKDEEMDEILEVSDHVVFNSVAQWEKWKHKAINKVSCGLRINPQYSEIEVDLYNPCAPNSRMGIRKEQLQHGNIEGIEGLHFHTMCEQGADTLERTLHVIERDFHELLHHVKWLNMGGGHHISKQGYDVHKLKELIQHMQDTYDVEVYLEPGEAVAIDAGYLVSSVLDIIENDKKIAILDTSAACHMPDVLEMPYRPLVVGASTPNDKKHSYILAGNTCLAGDVIGEYSFEAPLKNKDRILFQDMAMYTMVKNNTFNGMPLPWIYLYTKEEELICLKEFGYKDFKGRL